ncbi:MAG: hypothetical protein R3F43_12830 [bacterium]
MGIGVVRRGRSGGADFFVTELFVAPPVPVDVPGARQALEAAARAARRARTRDGGLEAVANGMAADLASGKLSKTRPAPPSAPGSRVARCRFGPSRPSRAWAPRSRPS